MTPERTYVTVAIDGLDVTIYYQRRQLVDGVYLPSTLSPSDTIANAVETDSEVAKDYFAAERT